MLKKICRMRYFITFAVVLTVLMSVYGIIRFHYKNITVSNTTPVNYEGFKILFEDGSCKKISLPDVRADSGFSDYKLQCCCKA